MAWEQLLDIWREDAEERRAERDRKLVDCPEDGTPLEEARGKLHCPFCGRCY